MRLQSGLTSAVTAIVDDVVFSLGVSPYEAQKMLTRAFGKKEVSMFLLTTVGLERMEAVCDGDGVPPLILNESESRGGTG